MNTESAEDWWRAALVPANRAYAIGAFLATLIAFAAPHVLWPFIPCAQFMEVEWMMVGILCLAGIGALNVYFAVAVKFEVLLPYWSAPVIRNVVLFAVPLLVFVVSLWLAFSPFWYALFNDPDLLCD